MRKDYKSEAVLSPNKEFYFVATVNRTDESKEDFAYVIISIFSDRGKIIGKVNSRAGDFNKWAIGWTTKGDTICLNSTDIGIKAWQIDTSGIYEVKLTDNIKKQAALLKKVKYN